jgi:ABC-type uncharacterized transport system substrate-binding protein
MHTQHNWAASLVLKLILASVLTPVLCLAANVTKTTPTVAVVTSSQVEAYNEALGGLRQELGLDHTLVVIDLDGTAISLSKELSRLNPEFVVAVGTAASRAVAQADSGRPYLVTMVVDFNQGSIASTSKQGAIGVVSLDLPFGTVLQELRTVFPDKTRVGVIYSKASSGLDESSLQAEAALQGFSVSAVECKGPEDVVDALVSLKRSVDIVWCPPDGRLFNATTVKPLIMASLRHQMLITGFSEGFVRAGTAVGVYPDFEAVGRQAGTAVRLFLRHGMLPGKQAATHARVAVNERVLRLLGETSSYLTDHKDSFKVLK